MVGYVMIGSDCYYLKVAERGRPVIEYCVTDLREAVYWILLQLVERAIQETGPKEIKNYKEWEWQKKERMLAYFDKMNSDYRQWYAEGRNLWRFVEGSEDQAVEIKSKKTRYISW